MNNAKSTSKGFKGQATVFEDAGRLKINLPRQYFGGKQIKKALGLQATAENWAKAERIARRVTEDLQDGRFKDGRLEEILSEYGIKTNLVLVPKVSGNISTLPKLSILDVWEKYLEYIKPNIKENYFKRVLEGKFTAALSESINSVGSDPIAIRTWMLTNRCFDSTYRILSHLNKAYKLLLRQKLVSDNPFEGMTDGLKKQRKSQFVNVNDEETDSVLYDPVSCKKKAFTVNEVRDILDCVSRSRSKHYYNLLKFLFLTGCRTNEATAFMWGDVKWDKEYIVFDRSYCRDTKKFVSTKTNHTRLFPMPNNGHLWEFLKSIQPLEKPSLNQLVFPNKKGAIIDSSSLGHFWRGFDSPSQKYTGLIPKLIAEGKVSKYLPVYNTRHTFISYQINECGVPPHVVKDWCGHSEDVTTKIYRQENLLTKPVSYDSKPMLNQLSEPSEVEVLKQQVQLLMEQNKMLQEMIVSLETRSKESNAKPIS